MFLMICDVCLATVCPTSRSRSNCDTIKLRGISADTASCPQQVVWWSTLLEKFQPEISGQPDVFGGEHGEQRTKDFRSVHLLLMSYACPLSGRSWASLAARM